MRAFVERVIRISGLTADCVKVSNGHEALGVLRKEKVDLVLTDISMPGMDGETLLSAFAPRTGSRIRRLLCFLRT